MKACSIVIAAYLAAGGVAAAQTSSAGRDQVLTRISTQTGVPVDTLRRQAAETGLSFGDLEKANLLADASGHSFRQVVSRFKAGEGWGEIAHDAGLNLGELVSDAHRSENATQHGRDEEARGDQDRDEHGRDEQARGDQDRDEQVRGEPERVDRGDGEEARDGKNGDEGRRDERAHGEKGHAQNAAAAPGHRRVLTRISNQTGVPARKLARQKAKTGLGFGALEKANLLAQATGRSFRRVVSRFRSGEGFGKIAHNGGLNMGKLVSRAHRSDKAAQNAHKTHPENAHGKSTVVHGRSAVARGDNRLQRASAVAHGNNGLNRASAVSRGGLHMGTMNGFGHSGVGSVRGSAAHGMGGHGGGGR